MKIKRLYTKENFDPYHGVVFASFEKDVITAVDMDSADSPAEVSFEKDVFYFPVHWDAVSKSMFVDWLMLKDGVPTFTTTVQEEEVPAWLWPHEPDWEKLERLPKTLRTKGEKDVRDVLNRIAGGWTYAAWKDGVFDTNEDAQAFYDEVRALLINRMVFPETAQWKFVGVDWAYGYSDNPIPDYAVLGDLGKVNHAYPLSREKRRDNPGIWGGVGRTDSIIPEAGNSIASDGSDDDGEGFDWANLSNYLVGYSDKKEHKTNVQKIVLSADHPEIESFIDWKLHEEYKIASLIIGSRVMHKYLRDIVSSACEDIAGKLALDVQHNAVLAKAIDKARKVFIPEHVIQQVLHLLRQGIRDIDFSVFDTTWDGEAYRTVHGSKVHTAVRVPHTLVEATQDELLFDCWTLRNPVTGEPKGQTSVRSIWDKLAIANWHSTEPTIEFDTTIQEWNTCQNSGKLHSSSPSGGYIFQDGTYCFGATFNLKSFVDDPIQKMGGWHVEFENGKAPLAHFQSASFSHAVRLMTIALDTSHTISLKGSLFPATTNRFRSLGMNYCDLSAVLMRFGLAYDSDEARSFASAVTALMTAEAYAASSDIARKTYPFDAWEENREPMQKVIRNYQAIVNGKHDGYDGLTVAPPALLDVEHPVVSDVVESARDAFARAGSMGQKFGYRNAFVSLISPLSKSSMAMGGRISGIEPETISVLYREADDGEDYASDNGMVRDINPNIPYAMRRLGYTTSQIMDVCKYVLGQHSLRNAPHINFESLVQKGFTAEHIQEIESVVADCYDIRFAFNRWTLGDDFCINTLGIAEDVLDNNAFDLLPFMGFTPEQIDEANEFCCGSLTIENAPHIKVEHQDVFDCVFPTGRHGTRRIGASAHVLMAASVGAFVSGGVGTTIALDYETSVETIKDLYFLAWSLGMKNISLYRQGAKLCQSRFQDIVAQNNNSVVEEDNSNEQDIDKAVEDMDGRDKNVVTGIFSSPSAKRVPLLASQLVRYMSSQQKMKDARSSFDELQSSVHAVTNWEESNKDGRNVLLGEPMEKSAERSDTDSVSRESLPQRRKGYTQKAKIGGHKIYLRTGEYSDGTLGEIFIDMHKEGEAFRSLLNNFAVAISMGLQYGVPLESFVDAFTFTRFEPAGVVDGNEAITTATSVLDYIFRELAISYLGRSDFANVEKSDSLDNISKTLDSNQAKLDPDTLNIIRQAVSGGYSRQNLKRVQQNLLNKITANSNLAIDASLEDERISALGIEYEDVDEETLEKEFGSSNMKEVFQSSVRAMHDALHEAREKGYVGESCQACGHMTVLKIGHFLVCDTCSYINEDM